MPTEREAAAAVARERGGFVAAVPARPALSSLGSSVRRHDPDRFFLCLLMPATRREAAFSVVAFDHELARATGLAARSGGRAESLFAARVRLQWWREMVEGARPRHEVATPLGILLDDGAIDARSLLPMIDVRERALDQPDGAVPPTALVDEGAGALAQALGVLVGLDEPAVRWCGIAGRAYGAGLRLRRVVGGSPDPAAARVALEDLARAGPFRAERARRAPALHAVLARRDLRRAAAARQAPASRGAEPVPRGVGDRLAVVRAWLVGLS